MKQYRTLVKPQIHLRNEWLLLVVFLFCTAGVSQAQDLQLDLAIPKTKVKLGEPLNISLKVINVSAKTYYVTSDIDLGMILPVGRFRLQVRDANSGSGFVNGPEYALDPIGIAKPATPIEFVANNNLCLLKPDSFIGKVFRSDWAGLTLLGPGRYSIRITYDFFSSIVPKDLPHAMFTAPLVSNVIELEIQNP
jgi:hypothetical protein